jgi:NAD(P)-dependent dehydrogenase (short-subunit alcohol dehydrogenase family)
MSERLPRPIRLLLGATSYGVSDRRLRHAVDGKIVLVTGASSGVGQAAALRLGAAGATVLLVARREELLEEIRDSIADDGGNAFVYPCNLADTEQVGELVDEVIERHGHVDVVVSNAGLSIRRWLTETYERFHDIERTINVNYLGPVRLLLGLLPSMRQRGSGHIVSVATIGLDFPPLRWSSYIASKAAFETWLSGVAPEIRADGVTTTSIHLQLVRSPMLGPFRMWNYLPGMSSEEAAGIVARAIVERPRTISPPWARVGAVFTQLAREPLELALAGYASRVNPESKTRSGDRPSVSQLAGDVARVGEQAAGAVATIASTRLVRPIRPDRLARALLAQARFGATPAFLAAAAAELYGDRPAVIDETGTVTFRQLDAQSRSLAAALHEHLELVGGSRVAIMCRNHRGFVQAEVAATRLGCDIVPLNNDFAGPQLADVLAREGVTAAIHDEEFEQLFDDAGFERTRIVAWHEGEAARPTLDALIELGTGHAAPSPREHGRIVMLTSGTTGTPRGAMRAIRPGSLAPLAIAGLLDVSRIKPTPRSGEPFVVAPPLFHLYGMIGLAVAFAFGSPIVIRRRFDSEAALDQIERTRAGVLLAVPTMLSRIMRLRAVHPGMRRPRTCARRPEPWAGRRPASGSRSSTRKVGSSRRERPGGSSSAARFCSRVTPGAAARR